MGDIWITDMTHLEGEGLPSATARLQHYFGRIVEAATAWMPGAPLPSAIQCRRRPARRPCPGHLEIRRPHADAAIGWHCDHCNDRGFINNWRACPRDLSTEGPLQAWTDVDVDIELYRVLEAAPPSDPDARRMVMRAFREEDGLLLAGTAVEHAALRATLRARAEHETSEARRSAYLSLADRLG